MDNLLNPLNFLSFYMDSININEFNILILLKQRVFGFQLAVLPGFSMPTISLHSIGSSQTELFRFCVLY